ncbi:MAG: quinone-dependent dihydroorotate dehydrogenase [Ktedonobacterales bacterium]
MLYRRFARPVLFGTGGGDPETVHESILGILSEVSRSRYLTGALERLSAAVGGYLPREAARQVFGLQFPSPVGLAAGFDKNASAVPALAALGFGFVEIGTVTPNAQPGNPRPRLFRLPHDEALINRMGFNNEGAEAVAARLAHMNHVPVPIGVSLGKSRATPPEEAARDYRAALDALYPWGDYFAVNVSSPNTPGLRVLQRPDQLDALLAEVTEQLATLAQLESPPRISPKPLLVKIAPDLQERELEEVAEVCLLRGVSGLIAANTTISRDRLSPASRAISNQAGGLSGRPLLQRALSVVSFLHGRYGDRLPIIGCGGISSASDASRMLDAGAVLLQLYTSFIYEGPLIARRIARRLARIERKG